MTTPQNDTCSSQLGFRVEPEIERKVKELADIEDVPYAVLLRSKARELADRYDRIVERTAGREAV